MSTTNQNSNASPWNILKWPRAERYGGAAVLTALVPPAGVLMFIALLFHEATQLGQKALDALHGEWRDTVNAVRKTRREWSAFWWRVWWKVKVRFTPEPAPPRPETSAERVQRATHKYRQDVVTIERLPVNDVEKAALERAAKKSMLFRVKGEIEGNNGGQVS